MQFHLYYDGIEVAEPPITRTELQQYRRDSKHAAEQRKAYRLRKIRASSRYLLASILNRLTLPSSTISVLAFAGTALFAHATIYA